MYRTVLLGMAPIIPALKSNHLISPGVVGHHEYRLCPRAGTAPATTDTPILRAIVVVSKRRGGFTADGSFAILILRRARIPKESLVTRDHWSGEPG